MFSNKNVHLIGIGGISMSSIALMLKNMNANVTGTDIYETDLTHSLESKGIIIKYGHHPEMINDADIVIYTAAISENDPEIRKSRGYYSRGRGTQDFDLHGTDRRREDNDNRKDRKSFCC